MPLATGTNGIGPVLAPPKTGPYSGNGCTKTLLVILETCGRDYPTQKLQFM